MAIWDTEDAMAIWDTADAWFSTPQGLKARQEEGLWRGYVGETMAPPFNEAAQDIGSQWDVLTQGIDRGTPTTTSTTAITPYQGAWGAQGNIEMQPVIWTDPKTGIRYSYDAVSGRLTPLETETARTGYPAGSTVTSIGGRDVVVDASGRILDYLGATPTQNANLEQQRLAQEAAYNQQLIALRQQELAQEQKQYMAGLAANPASWLEYASTANQPPVIQPWMMPLMPQDYGISAGEPIPGWQPENMTGMPQLTTPSGQYLARAGPTAKQQYLGYERARTGATPEETQWRLWQIAPPGGRNTGFSQVR